ncbi:MAG: HAD hydrolase-like protein [Pseudomonadota bacterium]
MKTVVFDLDGTLADTSADLLAAANACFVQLGHGVVLDSRDVLTAFQGGRAMLRAGFDRLGVGYSEADISAQYPVLLSAYADGIDVHTKMYPGAIQAVFELLSDGYRTAVCTNKPEGLAVELLRRLGVSDLFGAVVGADTLPVRKPDPVPYIEAVRRVGGAVGRSMLIGDTETDRLTGLAAGVPVVLVTFGPEGAGVARLAPEALLDRYEDLPGLVARLLG